VVEEHDTELLGGIDVEALAGQLVDTLADAVQFGGKARRESGKDVLIDADAGLLHAIENGTQRKIDVGVDAGDVGFVGVIAKHGGKGLRNGRGGGQRRRRCVTIARRHVGERLRRIGWIQRVRKQHGVVDGAAQFDTQPIEYVQRELVVVDTLGDCGVIEERAQFGRERQAQGDLGLGANACGDGGFLLLNGFDNIKQGEGSLPVALGFDFYFSFSDGGWRGIEGE